MYIYQMRLQENKGFVFPFWMSEGLEKRTGHAQREEFFFTETTKVHRFREIRVTNLTFRSSKH